jgi:hypothetical protein
MNGCVLTDVLIEPESISTLTLRNWDLLIRQARHANLMGRLASTLSERHLLGQIPVQPRSHLEAALSVAQRQMLAVQWEVNRIQHALADISVPLILLKGAAYVMQQLPAAQGRMFADVDILVPKERLDAVELALKMQGWITTHHDAYDQRYYRTWMHELPPMLHLTRQTLLDVHHTILPETARLHPDVKKLFANAIPVSGIEQLHVLAPPDMVLHSATHLFHEGEFKNGLRDLTDLDALLRHFSQADPTFWETLLNRAQALDLTRPLFYALRYTNHILHTPIPPAAQQTANASAPGAITIKVMDALLLRALTPHHPSCNSWLTQPALRLLFVRSHWLKMPLGLLIRHLLHKLFVSPKETGKA